MSKSKKITLAILAVLVSATLIVIAAFSGTLAKFISTDFSLAAARAAKWGIEVSGGSDLNDNYIFTPDKSNPSVKKAAVQAKTNGKTDSDGNPLYDNVVVPGTKGSLAWLYVKGCPETKYDITVSPEEVMEGDKLLFKGFTVGKGFYAAERLIRDERGLPVEYFPIVIELYAYDVDENGQKTDVVLETYALKKSSDTATQNTYADHLYASLDELVTAVNTAIGNSFNSVDNAPNTAINRYYCVNWSWDYEPHSATAYHSDFLDTALCEAIAKSTDKSLFEIGLKMSVQIAQSN